MSVLDAFFREAATRPESVAILDGDDAWTYGWIAEAVGEMAVALRKAGCFECPEGHVPRVALDFPNGAAHVLWAMAVVHGGGCLVPVPSELQEVERLELLSRTACASMVKSCKDAANVEVRGFSAEVLRLDMTESAKVPEEEFARLEPSLIRFSSGTTGDSKGVVLSHRSLADRIASANKRLQITSSDRVLWVLPMAHHFAVSILLYLSHGAATVLCQSRMADDMLDTALRHEVTVFYGSPFHMAVLAGESSGRLWHGLRLAVSTAAPLREDVAKAFQLRFNKPVTQGLGIIEAGLPLLNTENALGDPLACGVPDDFDVRLVNGGVDGDEGELWLRGPGMFDAYLSPWRLRSGVLTGGWFRTGDLAVRGVDGSIRLSGRLKSVINVGGMKCFPEEIEAVLATHPGVSECRVYPRQDRRWGMVPCAEIVPVDQANPPSESEFAAFCSRSLAAHKVPVTYRFVEGLPKTASGKIKR